MSPGTKEKNLASALFTLNKERQAMRNPRDYDMPPAEQLDAARATVRRLDGLQLVQELFAQPRLVDNYLIDRG
jgi:hypothetical protein